MYTFYRKIFPVGHGGLSVESIGNTSVVFDCRTTSVDKSAFLDGLEQIRRLCTDVNYLVISHFDRDHVNGVKILLESGLTVEKAIVPFVDERFKIVFDAETGGAYLEIMNLLSSHNIEITDTIQSTTGIPLWEWIPLSLLCGEDWDRLGQEFEKETIIVERLSDATYVKEKSTSINKIVKRVFRERGPNTKGLILLSQKSDNAHVSLNELKFGDDLKEVINANETGCLYLGDADIRKDAKITDFLSSNANDDCLLLAQVPHHGSHHSSDANMTKQIVARYYFCCDQSDERIKKNSLYGPLKFDHQLLMVDLVQRLQISNKIKIEYEE